MKDTKASGSAKKGTGENAPQDFNIVKEVAMAEKNGDYIKFGSYYQEDSSKKTPIEWLVLKKKGDELLVISRYGLDCKQYHHEYVDVTWEECDLRKWLNNDFLKAAFTAEEQKKIKVSSHKNEDNPEYKTKGGNDTEDQVFCLSLAEAETLFNGNEARKCVPTLYAVKNGAWQNSVKLINGRGCCWWWLCSPGNFQSNASYVMPDGDLASIGYFVHIGIGTVRPALWVIWNR